MPKIFTEDEKRILFDALDCYAHDQHEEDAENEEMQKAITALEDKIGEL